MRPNLKINLKFMCKTRFILRQNKKDSNGLCPIRMIIAQGKVRVELSVPGANVKPSDWDAKKQKSKKDTLLNLRLDKLRLKAEQDIHDMVISGEKFTLQDVRDKVTGKSKIKTSNKIKAADYCMDHFGKNNFLAYSTRKGYKSLTGFILKYDPAILIEEIDPDWLEGFKEWYIKKYTPKKWTIQAKVKCVKRIVNHAYQAKVIQENKLAGFKNENGKASKKFLTPEEVKKLEQFCKASPKYANTVKPFLWCCFTGMRFGDMTCLTWGRITHEFDGQDHQYKLKYTMRKTNNEIDVVINNKALAQLELPIKAKDETVFGVISKEDLAKDKDHISKRIESMNSYMNRLLKEACKEAGLERTFSWHESRVSFFCLGLQLGIDVMSLKEIGGHSDVKVTQEYLQVIDLQKKRAMLAFDKLE